MKRPRKGKALRSGRGWLLIHRGASFAATLLCTINNGKVRLAIFSVPKRRSR